MMHLLDPEMNIFADVWFKANDNDELVTSFIKNNIFNNVQKMLIFLKL